MRNAIGYGYGTGGSVKERGVQVGERGTVEDIWQKVVTNVLRRCHGSKGGCTENHCIPDRRSGCTNPGRLDLPAP
jgi:hypothetical protein